MNENLIVVNGGAWLFDSTGYQVRDALFAAAVHYSNRTGRPVTRMELSSKRYDELVDYLTERAIENGSVHQLIPKFPLRMLGPYGPFDVVSA
jgi:hypothetical protein